MRKLYLECNSGISGDMFVAALIDLGADQDMLKAALKSIPVQGFEIEISRVKKSSLDVCDFNVRLDHVHENHDHDMEFLHGSGQAKKAGDHGHSHCEKHVHHDGEHGHDHHDHHDHDHHEHDHHEHSHHEAAHHENTHHHHDHEHRGMKEVAEIITNTDISEKAKKTAMRIFEVLGMAEAKAHGTTLDEVHFHEVGAIDSIVDIIAAAVCLDNLAVEEVIIPVLYEGRGTVRCQHGILPIPVPAVTNIVSAHDLQLHITDCSGELVTPTGAAIAAAIRTGKDLPAQFTVKGVGLGGGKRKYECPGFLRAMLIETAATEEKLQDTVYVLESNIDDCSGEALGHVMDDLLKHGAKDVSFVPIYMKKNRPAYQLNVICSEDDVAVLENIIFRETTTIGIRKCKMERTILKREVRKLKTSLGSVKVKLCRLTDADKTLRVYPEYDSISALCKQSGMAWQEVYQQVMRESYEQLQK